MQRSARATALLGAPAVFSLLLTTVSRDGRVSLKIGSKVHEGVKKVREYAT